MHLLTRAVRASLQAHANPADARWMQAYMRSTMPFYGVKSPVQRRVYRAVFAAHPLQSRAELEDVTLELWRTARFREERYAAIQLTDYRRYADWRTFDAIPLYEEMIVTGAWWDYVDVLASHHLGAVLRREPRRMTPLLRRWAKANDSIWKRRAAMLSQLGFKRDTNLELLYDCIEPNLSHPDFFIRKAIGWALRQLAWIDPREVKRYVAANRARLSQLTIREALKNVGHR